MAEPKHVLVVDHTSDVRDIIQEMLQEAGFLVSTADGGKSMRDQLITERPIDLVVMDASMIGENSSSLALHLKETRVALVMVSGNPAVMEFAQQHDLQLLWKPFHSADLVDAVKKGLRSHEFGQRDDA
jgi:two-component system OmpR family response regulator